MMPDYQETARRIRLSALNMVSRGRSSHIGSVLSCVDVLTVLYGGVLKVSPENPTDEGRDCFILSKGHAGVAVYATLAEYGFFPKSDLEEHYKNGSYFSGHVSHLNIPGVELSTGSLGHGMPVATGVALANKVDGNRYRSFVMVGDGELAEGANWEAMLFAAHNKLNNLVMIIDRNNLQSIMTTEETLALEPLELKISSFGWAVSVVDGHDYQALEVAMKKQDEHKPHAIIANTIKGKGVSYMENKVEWHYKFPDKAQLDQAIEELGGKDERGFCRGS